MVWGLACLLGSGLRLGLLRWLCARGGWHIWVLRGGCRDMAGSCGFEGAVILMSGARRRAPAGQSGRVGETPSDDDAGQCPTPAVKRSTTPFTCGTVFRFNRKCPAHAIAGQCSISGTGRQRPLDFDLDGVRV